MMINLGDNIDAWLFMRLLMDQWLNPKVDIPVCYYCLSSTAISCSQGENLGLYDEHLADMKHTLHDLVVMGSNLLKSSLGTWLFCLSWT